MKFASESHLEYGLYAEMMPSGTPMMIAMTMPVPVRISEACRRWPIIRLTSCEVR